MYNITNEITSMIITYLANKRRYIVFGATQIQYRKECGYQYIAFISPSSIYDPDGIPQELYDIDPRLKIEPISYEMITRLPPFLAKDEARVNNPIEIEDDDVIIKVTFPKNKEDFSYIEGLLRLKGM